MLDQIRPHGLAHACAHSSIVEPLGPLTTLVEVTHESWDTISCLYVEWMKYWTMPFADLRQLLATFMWHCNGHTRFRFQPASFCASQWPAPMR